MTFPATAAFFRVASRSLAAAGCLAVLAGCPTVSGIPRSERPPRAEKWYQRALKEYRSVAMDAAYDSARQALDIVPKDAEVRLLAARVALARLEFDEALLRLKGIEGSAASSLRGRAYWYKGELEKAADELETAARDGGEPGRADRISPAVVLGRYRERDLAGS